MAINLEKRAEKVGIVLEKRNVKTIPKVRVGLVVDTSGSAEHLFTSGVMQDTVDRLLAVAVKFDDNGELDMWHFNSTFSELAQATSADYGAYVKDKILMNRSLRLWGGTQYAPVMKSVIDFYFPEKTEKTEKKGGVFGGLFGKKEASPATVVPATVANDMPAMCFFITDGASGDPGDAERVLTAAQNKNVYWQLVGVGAPSHFGLLKRMADELPNVGFINLNNLNIADEQIYDQLISDEFCDWIKKF